jgi:stage V sporulation protein G
MAKDLAALEVTRMSRLSSDSSVKAFCDVAIHGSFLIKNLKVVDGKHGLFVSMPREQGKNGQWYDTVAPITKGAREDLNQIVLDAYGAQEPSLA